MPSSVDPLTRLAGPNGRQLRLAHLTTIDMSLALLLETELRRDVEVGLETFGLSAPGPYVERIERLGVTHVPIPALSRAWSPSSDALAARQLVTALRDLRPDILHTHNPKTGVLGRVLGRLLRVPVVVNTCHGLWIKPEDSRRRRAAVMLIEGLAAHASHAELFQNDEDRQLLARIGPRRRAQLVGNGVDLTRFVPDDAVRTASRQQLGFAEGELVVGGTGRLVAEKGIREFCTAAKAMKARATFVWAGPGDPEKTDALPIEIGQGSVRFLGEIQDMNAYYNAIDVFVLPSHREGFSRSAMEAAACGLPMVLSDIRGCREIGRHESELLLSPVGDATALANSLGRLLTDVQLRQRLGVAARRRAELHFDQRVVSDRSLTTYMDVADRRGLQWSR